jgi:Hemerythrin HHE cation binding domain
MSQRAETPRLSSAHNEEVERQCTDLLSEALARDPQALLAHWRRLEHGVRDHMAAEEELVVPGYRIADPADARRVCAEHAQLTVLLATLGREVEAHQIGEPTVRAFVAALRAHDAHEDAGMYRWASQHLAAPVRAAISTRLAQLLGAPRG